MKGPGSAKTKTRVREPRPTAEPSAAAGPGAPAWRPLARRYLPRGLLFLFVFLSVWPVPRVAYTINHDHSSHATFEFYAAHGFQFGRDVVQNIGPLGYAHYGQTYAGWVQGRKMVLQAFLKLVLAGLVLWAAASMLGGRTARAAWLLPFFLHTGIRTDQSNREMYVFTADIWPYLTVYLVALYLIHTPRPRSSRWAEPVLVYTLALLALMKHTLLMLGGAVLMAIAAGEIARGRRARAAQWLGLYTLFLLLNWFLAGQSLANLPDYVRGIRDFSAGYNEAMALEEPGMVRAAGIATLLLAAAASLYRVWAGRWQSAAVIRGAIEMLVLAVAWKHGFVRADEHVVLFFGFAVWFTALVLFAPALSRARVWAWGAYAVVLAVATVASTVALRSLEAPAPPRYSPVDVATHLTRNAGWLVRPGAARAEMEAELARNRQTFALPQIAALVGDARVDFFGYEPGGLLLNGLTWAPRPMPMSFMAANERLMRRNEAFYRDPSTAPEYVVASYGSIDARFPPLDDALALRALLDNYTPVGSEAGLLLLQRNGEVLTAARDERPIRRVRLGPGETLPLPEDGARFLWARITVRHTWLGRLRSLAYKPPACVIALRYTGGEPVEHFRFVTTMGSAGFLLSPAVRDNQTLLAAYAEDSRLARRPVEIAFPRAPGDLYFEPEIDVELVSIDGPRRKIRLGPPS